MLGLVLRLICLNFNPPHSHSLLWNLSKRNGVEEFTEAREQSATIQKTKFCQKILMCDDTREIEIDLRKHETLIMHDTRA